MSISVYWFIQGLVVLLTIQTQTYLGRDNVLVRIQGIQGAPGSQRTDPCMCAQLLPVHCLPAWLPSLGGLHYQGEDGWQHTECNGCECAIYLLIGAQHRLPFPFHSSSCTFLHTVFCPYIPSKHTCQ
jgi:hypothetical protein